MTSRLFVPQPIEQGVPVQLNRIQQHHILKVLRHKVGDCCAVFNAAYGQWNGTIVSGGFILPQTQTRPPLPPVRTAPTLIFAPVKHGRLDWVVQRATEMGCVRLWPACMERSVVRSVNEAKLHQYAIEAAQQCDRLDVPEVEPMRPLALCLKQLQEGDGILLCDEKHLIREPIIQKDLRWHIIIGPEGGLSEAESAQIMHWPACHLFALGPRILRADTAAVAALALYQFMLGDW